MNSEALTFHAYSVFLEPRSEVTRKGTLNSLYGSSNSNLFTTGDTI